MGQRGIVWAALALLVPLAAGCADGQTPPPKPLVETRSPDQTARFEADSQALLPCLRSQRGVKESCSDANGDLAVVTEADSITIRCLVAPRSAMDAAAPLAYGMGAYGALTAALVGGLIDAGNGPRVPESAFTAKLLQVAPGVTEAQLWAKPGERRSTRRLVALRTGLTACAGGREAAVPAAPAAAAAAAGPRPIVLNTAPPHPAAAAPAAPAGTPRPIVLKTYATPPAPAGSAAPITSAPAATPAVVYPAPPPEPGWR